MCAKTPQNEIHLCHVLGLLICYISSLRCGCTSILSLELGCVCIHHRTVCGAYAIGMRPKESCFDSWKWQESSLPEYAQGGSGSHPAFCSSGSQTFAQRPLLSSKNNHRSSQTCSSKSASAKMIRIQDYKLISQN